MDEGKIYFATGLIGLDWIGWDRIDTYDTWYYSVLHVVLFCGKTEHADGGKTGFGLDGIVLGWVGLD